MTIMQFRNHRFATVRAVRSCGMPCHRSAPKHPPLAAGSIDEHLHRQIMALVRLLARQAAREHLHRLAHPETDTTDED
jgi:hypothetical protein